VEDFIEHDFEIFAKLILNSDRKGVFEKHNFQYALGNIVSVVLSHRIFLYHTSHQ